MQLIDDGGDLLLEVARIHCEGLATGLRCCSGLFVSASHAREERSMRTRVLGEVMELNTLVSSGDQK